MEDIIFKSSRRVGKNDWILGHYGCINRQNDLCIGDVLQQMFDKMLLAKASLVLNCKLIALLQSAKDSEDSELG